MPAGNLAPVIEEIREGFAYANLHTQTSPGGEIPRAARQRHGHGD